MSHILDSALDAERREECARNDARMNQSVTPTLACAFRCRWPNACCQTNLRAFYESCEEDARAIVRGVKP